MAKGAARKQALPEEAGAANDPAARDIFTDRSPSSRQEASPAAPARPELVETLTPRLKQPPRLRRRTLLVLGPVVVAGASLALFLTGGRYVTTDNAYVRADKMTLTTDVSGIVAEIKVRDDDRVDAGQVLFRLDEEPFRIALEGARAHVGAVRMQVDSLKASYRHNMAQLAQARNEVDYYERAHQRQIDLANRQATTQATVDKTRHELEGARDRVVNAERQAQATLAQLGGSAETPTEVDARFRQAQSQVDRAERDLRRASVIAPVRGIVANVTALQVGQYLQAGQPAFSLVAADNLWIEASPKETDLTHLKPGDPATITVDTYPGRVWQATVVSVSPATSSEFSVLPAQNASANWVKVVQRIPVRLRVEMPPDAPALRVGMSVVAQIDTGHRRSLADLLRRFGL